MALLTRVLVTVLSGIFAAGCYDLQDRLFTSGVHGAPVLPAASPIGHNGPVLRFIAVGDVGTGASGQRAVADAMALTADRDSMAFVLLLGDNFYESGVSSVVDPQWNTKFEEVYHHPSLQIPFLAVLGNHDHRTDPDAQVEYTTHSARWTMPARYYSRSFTIDDSTTLELFCLDTRPMAYLDEEEPGNGWKTQLHWLDSVLVVSQATWKIVAGHHPLYSNGNHGGNAVLVSLLEPLFVRHGVDAYVAGHDHDLQLLKPVHGVHHIVSGAGGKHRDTHWRENTLFAATNYGYAVVGVSSESLEVEFYDRMGTLQFSSVIAGRGES